MLPDMLRFDPSMPAKYPNGRFVRLGAFSARAESFER
jgi:hypothetical protein